MVFLTYTQSQEKVRLSGQLLDMKPNEQAPSSKTS